MRSMRFLQSIQIRLIMIYALLILIAMQIIGVYFVRTVEASFVRNFTESLNKQVYLLAEYVEPYVSDVLNAPVNDQVTSGQVLQQVVDNVFTLENAEIQILDSNGIVLAMSNGGQANQIGYKNTSTEVNRALQGLRGNERTMQDLDGGYVRVVSMPVNGFEGIIGAVYLTASMEQMYMTIERINRIFWSGTILAVVLTTLLGILLSGTITRPVQEMTRQATALAEGRFDRRVRVLGEDEIGQLATAFNEMSERLQEALALNEEEKEKLSSVLSNMNDGVIAADERGDVIVINRRAREMLQHDEDLRSVGDVATLLGVSWELLDRAALEGRQTFLLERKRTDSRMTILHVTLTAIGRNPGTIAGIIAVLHDITEQKELEETRKTFVANVSHELRTPLTTLKSYLEALEDGAMQDPALASRFVAVARNETDRMIRLVTDLLQLSRLDSKQERLHKESINVQEMLEDVADRFSFQCKQRRLKLKVEIPPDMPTLYADRDQIEQVLDNLVSNAIKFTKERGWIKMDAKTFGNGLIEVKVSDNGVGIPEQDQQQIFERFYRADKARSRDMGGTGLGLSIAREIVRAHGGTIRLESQLDKGTLVKFQLPIGNAESDAV